MVQIFTHGPPTHPSEMLLEGFLNPMSLTQRELADAIHVPHQHINEIVHGRRSVTLGTALRLAKCFNMSADFWMNLQMRWEMYHPQNEETSILKNRASTDALRAPRTETFAVGLRSMAISFLRQAIFCSCKY